MFDAEPQDRNGIKTYLADISKVLKIDYECEFGIIRKQIACSEEWDEKVQKGIIDIPFEKLCTKEKLKEVRQYLQDILDDDDKAEEDEDYDSMLCLATQQIYDDLRCILVRLIVWQAQQQQKSPKHFYDAMQEDFPSRADEESSLENSYDCHSDFKNSQEGKKERPQ